MRVLNIVLKFIYELRNYIFKLEYLIYMKIKHHRRNNFTDCVENKMTVFIYKIIVHVPVAKFMFGR